MEGIGQEAEAQSVRSEDNLEFKGTGGELFSIWIVNILLSVATLGIYSAWAKVRFRKYLLVMTSFREERFDYHAKPWPILKGRLVVLLLVGFFSIGGQLSPWISLVAVILLTFLFPLLILKSFQFNVHNTSYRNIRFHFKVDFLSAAKSLALRYLPCLIPFILLTVTGILTGLDIKETAKNSEQLEFVGIAMGVFTLFVMVYVFFYLFPYFLNWSYTNLYDNLHYGDIKVNFESSKKEVFNKIVLPYTLKFFGLILVFGGIITLTTLLKLPELTVVMGVGMYLVILLFSIYFPFLVQHYIWNRITCALGESRCDLPFKSFFFLNLKNFVLMGFTLGLYYPWAKVSMTELIFRHRHLSLAPLNGIVGTDVNSVSAVSEEVGEAFDIDFEIGL